MEFGYSAQDLASYVEQGLRFRVHQKDRAVTLLGLKGITVSSPGVATLNRNEPDLYNDAIFTVWHENLAAKHHEHKCTLEPGRYYTEVSPHPQGAARLIECRLNQFKWGTHHGRLALVPAGLDVVVRDSDGNYYIDAYERVYSGDFQVRIHSGGTDQSSIGKWSAGCPAVSGGERGEAWQSLVEICKRHPFERFDLVISRGYDFYHWLLLKEAGRLNDFRATIHIGSKDQLQGGNVYLLQKLLNDSFGAGLNLDGDFGVCTLEKFLEAQRVVGVKRPKAVCSRPQWERLMRYSGPYEDEGDSYGFFD